MYSRLVPVLVAFLVVAAGCAGQPAAPTRAEVDPLVSLARVYGGLRAERDEALERAVSLLQAR